jgi:cobalt-zinc-cadmium resistance protein CzcA
MAFTLSFALLGAILMTLDADSGFAELRGQEQGSGRKAQWLDAQAARAISRPADMGGDAPQTYRGSLSRLLAVAFIGAPYLGSEFLPMLDEGNIWLTITLPPATVLDKTKEIEGKVRAILKSYPEVNNVTTQVGRPDDGTDPKGPNNMEIMADLKPHDTWRFADKEELIADMTKKIHAIPGVPTNFSQVIQDNVEEALSGVKGAIAIKIYGPNLEILEDKSAQVASVINGIRGAADVEAIKVGGQTELNITLNRSRMARYGLNINDVNTTIQTAMGGTAVNSFYEGDRLFDVTLRMAEPYRDAVDDVSNLAIPVPSGGILPLSAIAKIEVRQGAARVAREGGGRMVAVKANLLGRDQGGFVAEAMETVKAQVKLPPGYTMTWGGQFENQQRANKRLKVILPLSAGMIFILLFWAFRSMRKALLVILMVPFTLIGGLGRSGLGRAASVRLRCGGLYCRSRYLGTEWRHHGGAVHGDYAQRQGVCAIV